MAYTVAGRTFYSKKSIELEARKIRERSTPRGSIGREEEEFIIDLFTQFYPRDKWFEKGMDKGIKSVGVITISLGNRCFDMALVNGGRIQPSVKLCFSPGLAKAKPTTYLALRFEVNDQTLRYREQYFAEYANSKGEAPCELTGKLITATRGICEVDHIPPNTFKALVEAFLQKKSLKLEDIKTCSTANGFGDKLEDMALAFEWQDFHEEHARLRVLSRAAHVRVTQEEERARQSEVRVATVSREASLRAELAAMSQRLQQVITELQK